MNLAQKNAWFGLANCFLAITFFLARMFFYIPVPGYRFAPKPSQIEIIGRAILQFWPLALPLIALLLLFIPRKKQSPAEPDADERDRLIAQKAIRISYISVWFLLLAATIMTVGLTVFYGHRLVPPIILLPINLGVFLIAMAIYYIAILVLYRQGRSDE
jgi:hypothetical protein